MDCKPMKTSFKPLSEKQFSNARNQPLQNNEKPANDGQIPTRRLSRLGTYRTSLAMNYQKPSINNGLVSQRKGKYCFFLFVIKFKKNNVSYVK